MRAVGYSKLLLLASLYAIWLLAPELVSGYMHEPHPPFTVTTPQEGQRIQRGQTVNVTWEVVPGTRYPIYGYAAARTARTIAGLVKPDAERNDRYIRNIETYLMLTDSYYEWTVENDIHPGTYRLGIGFYFHEDSPIFHI
ncbi:hypothetical protein BCR43DRAFT_484785, partial [Syncephalastrum racemosum]